MAKAEKQNLKPDVCCCDFYPGVHPRYLDCDPDFEKYNSGGLWKEELKIQESCEHEIYDGVCAACGKVVDEKDALESNQRNGS